MSKQTHSYKVVLIGNANVGKTSLVRQYLYGQFTNCVESTIGATFFSTTRTVQDGKQIKLNIWDTAGQERYRSIVSMYYRNVDACILLCDLTNLESLNSLPSWIEDFYNQCNNSKARLVIVGNKSDLLKDDKRNITVLEEIADKYKHHFFITSVIQNTNVNEIFQDILDNLKTPFEEELKKDNAKTLDLHYMNPQPNNSYLNPATYWNWLQKSNQFCNIL